MLRWMSGRGRGRREKEKMPWRTGGEKEQKNKRLKRRWEEVRFYGWKGAYLRPQKRKIVGCRRGKGRRMNKDSGFWN